MALATMISPNVQRKAAELLARADSWGRGRRKRDSLAFLVFASQSAPGVYYQTNMDGTACTCPAARLSRSRTCCHKVAAAAKFHEARNRPFRSCDDLMDAHDGLVDAF